MPNSIRLATWIHDNWLIDNHVHPVRAVLSAPGIGRLPASQQVRLERGVQRGIAGGERCPYLTGIAADPRVGVLVNAGAQRGALHLRGDRGVNGRKPVAASEALSVAVAARVETRRR